MKFRLVQKSSPVLGVARTKRAYDLPFDDDHANRFLLLLIALMTYLALLASAGGLVLASMADRWSTGLSNRLTLEIPMMDAHQTRLSPDAAQKRIHDIQTILKGDAAITHLTVQSPEQVAELVAPWLGSGQAVIAQIPLPALIRLDVAEDDPHLIARLQPAIERLAPGTRFETHQSWLADLLRFTGGLSFAAYLIGLITAITTIIAVSGAVRTRMTAHHEQLEILHLMGASDAYITAQFQKHALQLALYGALAGFVAAMITLMIIDMLAGSMQIALLPTLVLSGPTFLLLFTVPALSVAITVFTTRHTVLHSLAEMP